MKKVVPVFKFLVNNDKVPIVHQHIDCHLIFDVKMNFIRKAYSLAEDHIIEASA